MTLKNNGGSATSPSVGTSTIRLLPGEVMMFSPFLDPNRTWLQEESGTRIFSDWDNDAKRAFNIDGIPGWRGDGIGFDLDWFCPAYNGLLVTDKEVENGAEMWRGGCIAARATDEFSVKFAPLSVPGLSNNKFTVEIFAKPAGSGPQISSAVIEMNYEKPTGLQDALLGSGGTITYPKSGTINAMAMHSHSATPIKNIVTTKPFAIVSAQAKATLGGATRGRRGWQAGHQAMVLRHPASIGASSAENGERGLASGAHEFAFQRLTTERTTSCSTIPKPAGATPSPDQTGNTGLKFGAMYDIPLTPLQSLASLNGANPGGSSSYLAAFRPTDRQLLGPSHAGSRQAHLNRLLGHACSIIHFCSTSRFTIVSISPDLPTRPARSAPA